MDKYCIKCNCKIENDEEYYIESCEERCWCENCADLELQNLHAQEEA